MADTATVTVACNLPHGLQCDVMSEPNAEGARSVLHSFLLRGTAAARRLESEGNILGEISTVFAGYGLTEVAKDVWDEWVKQNAAYIPFVNGSIFAMPKLEAAKAEASDRKKSKVKSGFEPIDPSNPGEVVPELAKLDEKVA